jgi:AcrR family transcriptional regulator
MTTPTTRRRARRNYTPRMPAEARREQLMDAALDVIVRDGYRAISVEAVVREVDVTRPVFYNVFESLDTLLSELLDRQEQRALRQLAAVVVMPAPDEDMAAFLERTVHALVTMVRDDPRTWMPILHAGVDTPDVVRERIERDKQAVRSRFRDFAQLATAHDDRVDADVVAHALLALGEYFGRRIVEDPASVDADRLAATLAALVGRI